VEREEGAVTDTNPTHDVHRLSFGGGIDADSHILEPLDLWTDYIDPRYRDRALRVEIDADGLEAMVVDDRRPFAASRGSMSLAGAMGERDLRGIRLDPDRTYDAMAPFGRARLGGRGSRRGANDGSHEGLQPMGD